MAQIPGFEYLFVNNKIFKAHLGFWTKKNKETLTYVSKIATDNNRNYRLIFYSRVISVCDYFLHEACQEFAVPNCVESATYDPAKSLNDPKNCTGTTHHFQEGNLPNNSKCVKCRRSCWSAECLTGMRCQWCGLTVRKMRQYFGHPALH